MHPEFIAVLCFHTVTAGHINCIFFNILLDYEPGSTTQSKPFALAELEARIRSLTQRQFIQPDVCLSFGTLRFDTRSRIAAVNGKTVSLTKKESGILEYLLLNQGRPVSQEELIDHVWDNSVDGFSNSIRVHISALRKKLRAAMGYDPIHNRIGEGYLLGGPEE